MANIPEIFGCSVFNETVMKNKLPKNIWIKSIVMCEILNTTE